MEVDLNSDKRVVRMILKNILTLEKMRKKHRMIVGNKATSFFTFIKPDNPFYPQMQRLIKVLSENPLQDKILEWSQKSGGKAVHTDISGVFVPGSGWEFNRFYWSYQYWDETSPLRFRAITLFYTSKNDRIEFYEFPNDTNLKKLASLFEKKIFLRSRLRKNLQIDVLRYVPFRRFTFRVYDCPDAEFRLIGKMKKRSRFKIAYDRLLAVSRAVDSLSPSFQVASSRGIDEKRCLFFQDEMKGQNLSAVLDGENCKDILYSVGAIHYDLHSLDTHEVPEWDFPTLLDNLEKVVKWIIFFKPEHSKFLDYILDLLMKHVPDDNPREYTFCHGDFICSQILMEGTLFSVTDFDLARRGDPYHEIAILIASLKYDVPFFEKKIINSAPEAASILAEGTDSYLSGYQEKAQIALNRKRLLWYQILSEISYLALRFKKDRLYPNTVDNTIDTIHNLSELFQQEKGR